MTKLTDEMKPSARGISAPVSQITSQGITQASLIKRLREMRLAVEEWKRSTLKTGKPHELATNIPQPDIADTDRLAAAFIAHLSETQQILLEASDKLHAAIETSNMGIDT